MEDEKRKRTRKRPRRGKKSEEAVAPEQDTEGQNDGLLTGLGADLPMKSTEGPTPTANAAPDIKIDSTTSAATTSSMGGGPTLSFYQRTNPHKPSALPSLSGSTARRFTVSVALPGSIILNAQTPELQSRLAGHIARSCAIFNVDEIVVFDEGNAQEEAFAADANGNGGGGFDARRRGFGPGAKRRWDDEGGDDAAYVDENDEGKRSGGAFDPNGFLARILQYVETPQYLRKSLFPMHRDLRLAGLLAPLDCPHHLRYEDQSPYREGITVQAPHWAAANRRGGSAASPLVWVHTGLRDPVGCTLAKGSTADVPIGARVTVRMPKGGREVGQLVSPREPVEQQGLYWGYTVRLCSSLSEVISGTSFADPYDFVIGTSERGASLTDVLARGHDEDGGRGSLPSTFEHALIVFGGLSGLEVAVERDAGINATADEASELFDAWVNVVEGQGSRTIRTEEALLITLARLKTVLESTGKRSL